MLHPWVAQHSNDILSLQTTTQTFGVLLWRGCCFTLLRLSALHAASAKNIIDVASHRGEFLWSLRALHAWDSFYVPSLSCSCVEHRFDGIPGVVASALH